MQAIFINTLCFVELHTPTSARFPQIQTSLKIKWLYISTTKEEIHNLLYVYISLVATAIYPTTFAACGNVCTGSSGPTFICWSGRVAQLLLRGLVLFAGRSILLHDDSPGWATQDTGSYAWPLGVLAAAQSASSGIYPAESPGCCSERE